MVSLTVACCSLQSPQKWIGSSVALGFDDAAAEAHESGSGFSPEEEARLRQSVLVKIFDWGRRHTLELQNRLRKLGLLEVLRGF